MCYKERVRKEMTFLANNFWELMMSESEAKNKLEGINTLMNMNFICKHCKRHKKFISWFDNAV